VTAVSHSAVTVGIDIGTTSVKGIAVDADGSIVGRTRVAHPVSIPAPDRLEHDADRAWRKGPLRAWRDLAGLDPAAVAVSSMVPSLTAVDAEGWSRAPGLLYGDARGRTTDRGTGSDAGELLGFLRWTAEHAPDAAGYWPAPAVANYALGKVGVVDIGTAFSSAPVFGADGWDAEVCASVGVDVARLPRIEMVGAAIGHVHGSHVVLGGGCVDGMCEQLVAGADQPGDVHVICGTTLITWITTAEAVEAPGLWSVPHPVGGRWVVGGPSNAGGLFLGAVDRMLASRKDDRLVPDDVPVWSPYLRGERTPLHDPDRRGQLHGVTLTHGPAAVRRAAWEAAGFVVRHHIDLAAQPVTRIMATGGGTQVEGWMQALADCTGLPVHAAAAPEGAALGAAFLARMAVGYETDMAAAGAWARTGRVIEPDPVWQAAADSRYPVFRKLADGATLT
jgi:xylulokinase